MGSCRSEGGGDKVKIAALTASVFKEERDTILTAGCDEMVAKPLEEPRLFQVMGKLLNLDYCYETGAQTQAEATTTPPDLSQLPSSLQAELKAAAERLDMEAIHDITAKMQDYAQIINGWVDSFRFDTLLEALKKPAVDTVC